MTRSQSRLKPKIGEQCDFLQDAATRNGIFIIRILSEWIIITHKDLYLCFIDYTKVFDKVQHEKTFEMFELHKKDVQSAISIMNKWLLYE